MKLGTTSLIIALNVPSVLGQLGEWAQCGGNDYSGSTSCTTGLTCVKLRSYYSQCQKGAAASTVVTRESVASDATEDSSILATGFVGVSGEKFTLNNATFNVVGTNAYWLAQLGSASLITTAFNEIKNAGATVVRTWGFNDVTSSSGSGTFYQVWSNGVGTINTGANGLGKFDIVVAQAKAAGIRLIVALTNNWGDYGGMDVYISQLGAGSHNNFYTNEKVKTAYKKYVSAFIGRYKDEPTIFAWELANEPRCKGCAASVLTTWATEMSAYIKSIDPNHLVALGDEGFFNQPSNPGYPYQGGEGVDFEANLKIASIDFGTFHAYPTSWGVTSGVLAWGQKWVTDHANVQKSVGKPVVIEEYGISTSDQSTVYQAWWSTILSTGLAGDLYWQAGSTASGSGYDDGLAIFPNEPAYPLVQQHSKDMKARS